MYLDLSNLFASFVLAVICLLLVAVIVACARSPRKSERKIIRSVFTPSRSMWSRPAAQAARVIRW
jgi:hypothetical protein